MTIKEWHKSFDQKLQKVASNAYSLFNQDEIDMLFNDSIDKYVKEKFTKSIVKQNNMPINQQKNLDDLRKIIVKNKRIKTFVPIKGQSSTDYLYERNVSVAPLPHDYLFLINDRAVVKHYGENSPDDECDCDITSGFNVFHEDPNLQEYIVVLPFVAAAEACCTPAGNNLQIVFRDALRSDNTYGDVIVFDYFSFTKAKGYDIITKLKEESDKYVIINLLLEYLNRFNSSSELQNFDFAGSNTQANVYIEATNRQGEYFRAYWENYKDQYYPNSIILVSKQRVDIARQTSPAATSSNYITDADFNFWNDTVTVSPMGINVELRIGAQTPNVIGGTVFSSQQFRQVSYSRMMSSLIDYEDNLNPLTVADLALPNNQRIGNQTTTDWVRNKMVSSENLYRFINSPFAKPTKKEPISNLSGNYIFLYSDGSFIINEVLIDYVKKPRKVSLRYAQSCELADHTHSEIIDRAVIQALEIIQSPRFQSKVNEFQLFGQ